MTAAPVASNHDSSRNSLPSSTVQSRLSCWSPCRARARTRRMPMARPDSRTSLNLPVDFRKAGSSEHSSYSPVRSECRQYPTPSEQAAVRRSRRRLVSDKPVKSVTINDLAIGCAPGLWREWVEHRPVNGEFVEPFMQDCRFGGSQQREHDAFKPDRCLAFGCVRSCQSNDAVEHSMSYGFWRAVAPAEVLVSV